MLALFLIGLLASGLHVSLAQIGNSRRTTEERLTSLEELVKALGNGLDKMSGKLDKLLDDARGDAYMAKQIWLPLVFIEARRQYGEENNTFSFRFKSALPTSEVQMMWRLQAEGAESVTNLTPANLVEVLGDRSYSYGVTTAVQVDKRGELTLTLMVKGFEVILLFDNSEQSSKQTRSQRDIPFHNFAVDVPDMVEFHKGEQVILPVMAKNAGEDKYKVNVGMDLSFINPSKHIAVQRCLDKGQNDLVCESDIKKKYFSSMDLELLINTGIINPTGYSKVLSTYEDLSALVQGVRLTRVLKIVPSGQNDAYPEDFYDVVAYNSECSLMEEKCDVSCSIYGQLSKGDPRDAEVAFYKVNEDGQRDLIPGKISYVDKTGEKLASVSFKTPEAGVDIEKQKFVCSVQPTKNAESEKIESPGIVTYTYKAHVLKDKSYLELNTRMAKVRCSAAGLGSLETSATLSVKRPGREDWIPLSYRNYEHQWVGKRELASVFTFPYNFAQLDFNNDVKATCFARDKGAADFDSVVVENMKYLRAS